MNKDQLQKLAIQANVRHNGMERRNNNDDSLLFAILTVLIILFVSFICLLINL